MLYFIQSVEGGPVKIGTTKDLSGRVKQLEANYRTPMVVLATTDGTYKEERAMHRRFSHLRLGRTEQFRPEPELMEFIGMPLFACATDVAPLEDHSKPLAIQVRGSDEFKSWVEEFAAIEHDTVAKFIERVLRKHAREIGFREMPRR